MYTCERIIGATELRGGRISTDDEARTFCDPFSPLDLGRMQQISVFLTTENSCKAACILAQRLVYCTETQRDLSGNVPRAVRDGDACASAGLLSLPYRYKDQVDTCAQRPDAPFQRCVCEEICKARGVAANACEQRCANR